MRRHGQPSTWLDKIQMDPIKAALDSQFVKLDLDRRILLADARETDLFPHSVDHEIADGRLSFGELLLRSAAAVEQSSGGITTRLWDDPFEWTLQETLHSKDRMFAYFDEVENARVRAFNAIGDADLEKLIPAPEEFRSILQVLLRTLSASSLYLGAAKAAFNSVNSQSGSP